MRHRIVELAAFLVGRSARLPLVHRGWNRAMVAFEEALPDDLDDRLRAFADVPELPDPVSVSTGFEEGRADGSEFDHSHAVATRTPAATLPDDLDRLEVGAGTWAVFETEPEDGPPGDRRPVEQPADRLLERLQNLWAESFGEWLPSNPYRVVPGPEILLVDADDEWTSGRGELWIPVEREPMPGSRT